MNVTTEHFWMQLGGQFNETERYLQNLQGIN